MTTRFDPSRHHRRSIRLPEHDYRSAGAYFVTICTHQWELVFDDPVLRRVAETIWQRIPHHFPHVHLDAWVVMPNHLHGILVITHVHRRGEASLETDSHPEPVAANTASFPSETAPGDASPLPTRPTGAAPRSLGAIVGNFKSVTARRINRLRGTPGAPLWQRNYYEHIVRNEHVERHPALHRPQSSPLGLGHLQPIRHRSRPPGRGVVASVAGTGTMSRVTCDHRTLLTRASQGNR